MLGERVCDPLPEGVEIEVCVTEAVAAADAVGLPVGDIDWLPVVDGVLLGDAVRVPESVAAWLRLAVDDEVGLGLGVNVIVADWLGDTLPVSD